MMKLPNYAACLFAAQRGNMRYQVAAITDCNGRCRNGWVFGQGFDSPQVHKNSLTGQSPVGLFFCILRVLEPVTSESTLGFWTGAHEVRWTSVLRRPERSVDRLPSGPLKMDCVKTAEIPYLCGFPLFFYFCKKVISDRFRPFQFKKSGVQTGVQK